MLVVLFLVVTSLLGKSSSSKVVLLLICVVKNMTLCFVFLNYMLIIMESPFFTPTSLPIAIFDVVVTDVLKKSNNTDLALYSPYMFCNIFSCPSGVYFGTLNSVALIPGPSFVTMILNLLQFALISKENKVL